MGVRILHDRDQNYAALYCSTSDLAFGPLFMDGDDFEHDAHDRAEAFLRWLPEDARKYADAELLSKHSEWLAQEATQWQDELDAEDAAAVDDDEIEELKAQAEADHDTDLVEDCDRALAGDIPTRAKCRRLILDKYLASMKTFAANNRNAER